ncbi:helix-turn-helix domain-containing protein [Amycolatopsis sp. NPDC003861]
MPGPPLLPEVGDAIADAIRRTPTPTQRAIAREFDVSVSTVYRVAADYDLADATGHDRPWRAVHHGGGLRHPGRLLRP